jgi:hypothetical protein
VSGDIHWKPSGAEAAPTEAVTDRSVHLPQFKPHGSFQIHMSFTLVFVSFDVLSQNNLLVWIIPRTTHPSPTIPNSINPVQMTLVAS